MAGDLVSTVPAALEGWLAARLPDARPPFALTRIAGGFSMFTYRLTDASGGSWVLRHPPPGESGGGAHDAAREARVMAALADTDVPVPRMRAVGTPADPLGLPCHVTDFVEGVVVGTLEVAREALSPSALHQASRGIVTTLAVLHAVEPRGVGLGDLARAEDYNGRQVRRWRGLLADLRSRGSRLDAGRSARLDDQGAALADRLPRDRSGRIVHGDYRLGNAITGTDGSIRAVLDWELVTLGEPLADLGMLLAYWDPPPAAMLGVRAPTSAPGSIDRDEALSLYAEASGRDVSTVDDYQALASWRIACLCLRSALRFDTGAMATGSDPRDFQATTDVWSDLTAELLGRR